MKQMADSKSTIDVLGIADLIVSALIPIVLVWLGYIVNRASSRRAYVTERKIAVFDRVAEDLNDLYCYFMRVGNWKDHTPPELLAKKRKLDRIIYINKPLLSRKLYQRYEEFMFLGSSGEFVGRK